MSERKWTLRPELNFCPDSCWFAARIESTEREIGTMYVCLNCGTSYPSPDGVIPLRMTDEQFRVWHKEYVKKKYGDE